MGRVEQEYDHQERREVVPFIPTGAATVLDVGCAAGAFGRVLRETRPDVIVDGIEGNADAAGQVEGYRSVTVGLFPDVRPEGTYDAIVCNDVLEHMADPWGAVEVMREHLNPRGVVVASIPNMRYWPVLRGLLRGRWDYKDFGVLDRTHLRWFTKATMVEMFTEAGYVVERQERLSGLAPVGKWALVRAVARSTVDDVLTMQYVVVARRP